MYSLNSVDAFQTKFTTLLQQSGIGLAQLDIDKICDIATERFISEHEVVDLPSLDNLEKVIHFFSLGVSEGHAVAQYGLGKCYKFGKGVKRNEQKAIRLYTLAASQGHSEAQFELGKYYQYGEDSLQEAIRFYALAAKQGHSSAQCILGQFYEFGHGIEANLQEAIRLYTLAASQGHSVAQCNLGCCYELGRGVEVNLQEAIRLYTLAAKKMNGLPIRALNELLEIDLTWEDSAT
jgi:TPR repeat protein